LNGADTLFRDLFTNRTDFNVEIEVSETANTKVVGSSCKVERYEVNASGVEEIITERISGRAIDYYYA